MSVKFAREEYMSGKCTHEEYYGQFVTAGTRARVRAEIGLEALKKSTDPHFNDIPLSAWDRLVPDCPGRNLFKTAGDYYTVAKGVCLLKEAARQILAEAKSG